MELSRGAEISDGHREFPRISRRFGRSLAGGILFLLEHPDRLELEFRRGHASFRASSPSRGGFGPSGVGGLRGDGAGPKGSV